MPPTLFQYAEPISDISSSWTRSPSGANLYTAIDEYPFSISDSIQSPDFNFFPGLDWPTEHGLRAATDPGYYADGWAVLLEGQKFGAATNNIRVDLKNGATVLATWTITLTTSVADYLLALAPSDAAAIPPSAYAGGWSLLIDALPPAGNPSSFVVIYGARLQLPSVGFKHLDVDASGSGLIVTGPQSGHYLVLDSSGSGYKRVVGSETTGALILSGGDIKVST